MPNCERCPKVQDAIESTLNTIPAALLVDSLGNMMLESVLDETKREAMIGCSDGASIDKTPHPGVLGLLGVKKKEYTCTNPLASSKQPQ